jgi:hypothetical protein
MLSAQNVGHCLCHTGSLRSWQHHVRCPLSKTPFQEKALAPSPPDEVPNGIEDTRDSDATPSKTIIEKFESDIEEVSANYFFSI